MDTNESSEHESIEQHLIEIKDLIQKMFERQNTQFTELMLELKGIAARLPEQEDTESERLTEEEMYEKAKEIVIKHRKASTSLLQRTLRIGYAYAARLIDKLEDEGVVGPADGSKPRKVWIEPGSLS